eukprot:CAMPEP_0170096690 /NCGR_PEP_ID=MMETSP0019_2-20121128/28749_1 /TAXON_ID=98059 /ORGANISM="Dinobryon sp., Strain UTEXLB2267" /LENGTH=348 /DNA_ID=CAMNT_0010318755 /DNA_START=158 /DNA_END=1204 /DNA_ORIENTATION=-
MGSILESCHTLQSVYWPTPYCLNPHLQFVPYMIEGLVKKFVKPPFQWFREWIICTDGTRLALDWVVSAQIHHTHGLDDSEADETPIVMIHHGAMCDSTDLPGQSYIQPALDRNWIVCALNRRGHSGPLTNSKFNFFGCSDDVRTCTQNILRKRPRARLLTIGISSGSGLVARHMSYDESVNDFMAGVGICPGYDIQKCMKRFQTPYQDFLLWRAKDFFLKQNERLLGSLPGYHASLNASDLQQWLDNCFKMAGCDSTEAYYEKFNPMNHAAKISRPCLFINSEDDPICVVQNVLDNLSLFETSQYAALVLTKTGSHCPFYEGWTLRCWAEKAAYEFFDQVLLSASQQQ